MGQYRYFLKSPGLLEKFASKTCQAFFHYKVLFLRGGEQLRYLYIKTIGVLFATYFESMQILKKNLGNLGYGNLYYRIWLWHCKRSLSLFNEMAAICEAVGADAIALAKAIGLDGRIGKKFAQPGSPMLTTLTGFSPALTPSCS